MSEQQILSGIGYLEFTVSGGGNLVRHIGLNNDNRGTGSAEIPFAFKLVSGYAEVREYGQYRSDARVYDGDVLRISVENGTVKYARNGAVFYTSAAKAVYPLRADTSLRSAGAIINKAMIRR